MIKVQLRLTVRGPHKTEQGHAHSRETLKLEAFTHLPVLPDTGRTVYFIPEYAFVVRQLHHPVGGEAVIIELDTYQTDSTERMRTVILLFGIIDEWSNPDHDHNYGTGELVEELKRRTEKAQHAS